ncbi:unnamed protein product [Absidia cylindrospora]
MCNYQRPYTCGGAQKVNTCGAKPATNKSSCQGAYKAMSNDETSTVASSDDGFSDATSDTVTSPTQEKQGFIGGSAKPAQCQAYKGYSGCGGR